MSNHIYPTSSFAEKWRGVKEEKLEQKGKVFWMTGLSGSGKSTLAKLAAEDLLNKGYFVEILDGDNIRSGLCKDLGFSIADRTENIRRIAEVAKLLASNGIIIIVAFISPTKEIRALAKEIVGNNDFVEVYINSSLAACEKRDVKGLYKKARLGEITDFTGIQSPFEIPQAPKIEIKVDEYDKTLCSSHFINGILSFSEGTQKQ